MAGVSSSLICGTKGKVEISSFLKEKYFNYIQYGNKKKRY